MKCRKSWGDTPQELLDGHVIQVESVTAATIAHEAINEHHLSQKYVGIAATNGFYYLVWLVDWITVGMLIKVKAYGNCGKGGNVWTAERL